MHSNHLMKQLNTRKHDIPEEVKKYIDDSMTKVKSYVDGRLKSHIALTAETPDIVQKYTDTFVFDCEGKHSRQFELNLVEKDFETISLLNPIVNGHYTIAIYGSQKTAPKRFVHHKLQSSHSNIITRSSHKTTYIEMTRTYLMEVHVVKEGDHLYQCISLQDYLTDGSLARKNKKHSLI